MRIAQALELARRAGVARLDAQILLARRLRQPRVWLIAHDDDALIDDVAQKFSADLDRRALGEPLAYIVGEREFHGLMFIVTPDVLVPRPETELLVDWALERLESASFQPRQPAVVDLGTGSGAIALAIKNCCRAAVVTAIDFDDRPLRIAQRNAMALALEVEFRISDWWSAVHGRRFDLAVANPPYIADGDPHLTALSHEPRIALTPGGDGLGALRRIIEGAPTQLLPGAHLLLEHGHDQAQAVRDLLASAGFRQIATRADLAGLPRCTGGTMPP